jgi:hypothetical protein
MPLAASVDAVTRKIIVIRGERVMLDADLALLYGVTTKRLNQQVKRNEERFPPSFMLRITRREWEETLSQNATTSQKSRRYGQPRSRPARRGIGQGDQSADG